MASLRTHDVVLAEGTFRVVLTEKRRVLAVVDAPTTALGPLVAVVVPPAFVAVTITRSVWPTSVMTGE